MIRQRGSGYAANSYIICNITLYEGVDNEN